MRIKISRFPSLTVLKPKNTEYSTSTTVYFYRTLFLKWVRLPEPCPGMSSCYMAMARHLRFPLLSDQDFLRSLKKKSSMEKSRGTTCVLCGTQNYCNLWVQRVWASLLIQPLRKGCGSYVPNILPDRCHQAPNACWQEADLKNH